MKAQLYRMAPDLRRCCWYGIVGAALIWGICYWIARFVEECDVTGAFVICTLLPAAMIVALSWRLRLDEQGLARRFLFRWDFWSWEDFASGRIRKLPGHTLLDPERPWWRRNLCLDWLDDDSRNKVVTALNAHYRLPPAPEVPNTLTIRYGFRRCAVFDDGGIHLTIRGTTKEYTWEDLPEVHITRFDSLRRDFKTLEIFLPGEEIKLQQFSGTTAEEINEFLLRRLSAERIDTSIAGEPLRKRQHIERELRELDTRRRGVLV